MKVLYYQLLHRSSNPQENSMLIVVQFYQIRLKVNSYKAFSEAMFVVYHLYVLFFLTSNGQLGRNSYHLFLFKLILENTLCFS